MDKLNTALRPHGGYRRLRSFQAAEIIYDGTVNFCDRFVNRRSRTHDQMVQAARSGRQNIAEGSRASATSSQTELRLVNVARASLDELLLDYEDFLRQRGLRMWEKDDPQAREVRKVGQGKPTDPPDRSDNEVCPTCQQPMVLRTARKGTNAGSRFWGCSGYPDCRTTRPAEAPAAGS
jgi:four helix bundle protein